MLIPDGIWIGLDHDRYVADPALGSGDLKDILASVVQWHGRKRNPTWRALLAESSSKKALIAAARTEFGTAFHVIALEPEEFEARYCVRPPEPDLPSTKEDIARELIKRGVQPPKMSAKSIMFEAQARMHGIVTLADWKTDNALELGERIGISQNWLIALETMRKVMERHSQAMRFLSKGLAEVSVFYTDPDGYRFKIRMDYLRVRTVADLKTYALRKGLGAVESFNRSRNEFAYEVSAAQYMHVRTDIMPDLVAKGRIWRGNPELDTEGDVTALPATPADRKFFDEVAAWTSPRWWWVAASTGGVPEIDTIEFRQDITAFSAAMFQVEQAKATYREFRERFGPDDNELWVEDRGLIALTDEHHFSRAAMSRGSVLHETIEG